MPLFKMKTVWDYCTYNKPFFLLVLLLFCVLCYFSDTELKDLIMIFVSLVVDVIITGYGMTIARDRMNNGVRLPKILIKDVFVLGIKSTIVSYLYLGIQGFILYCISSPFDFPNFELEDMLLEWPQTAHSLFSHNPVHTLIFIAVSAVLFYITIFFIEISLARLADTGSLLSAFNLRDIKKNIDTIGWRHYAKEYTLMIFVIVIFLSATRLVIPNGILNYIWNGLLYLLAFVTQFLGIGKIYSEVKENESV